jgi:hypothetical protein
MTAAMIPVVYFFVPETVAFETRKQKPGAQARVN